MNNYCLEDKIYSVLVDNNDDKYLNLLRDNDLLCKKCLVTFKNNIKNIPQTELKYTDDYTSSEVIDICRDFINNVVPNYLDDFDKCIGDGTISIFDSSDLDNESKYPMYACYQYNKDEHGNYHHIINVPLDHTINDVYLLLHEFIHYTNSKKGLDTSDDRFLLTESVSILFEFLLYDYLKGSNISQIEIVNPILRRTDNYIKDSEELLYNIELINGLYYDKKYYMYIKDDDVKTKELKNIHQTMNYSLGTMIAILKYYDYMNNRISIDNIISYNDCLEENNNLESLNHIFTSIPNREEIIDAINYLKSDILNEKKLKKTLT